MAANYARGRIPYIKINQIHSFSNSHFGWSIKYVCIDISTFNTLSKHDAYMRSVIRNRACTGIILDKMAGTALLFGSCLLLLVVQSLSLCVLEDGTNSTCSSSSLLLVPRSQIKNNNGYSLIVDKLPNIATNCTSTNSRREFYAIMGGAGLTNEFLDKDNTTVKV